MPRRLLCLLLLALAVPAPAAAQSVVDDNPAVTSSAAGRLDVAARAADGTIVVRSLDVASGAWSPWTAVRGVAATSGPAISADDDGTLHLFTRAGAGNGFVESVLTAGTWSSWTEPSPGQFLSGPGSSNRVGTAELDLGGIGLNGAFYHAVRNAPGAAFTSFGRVEGAFGNSAPGMVSRGTSLLNVFTRAQDGTVLSIGYAPGSGWTTENLGGGILGAVSPISRSAGTLDIYARGIGGPIFAKGYDGTAWGAAYSELPGTAGTSAPAAATTTADGRVDMVTRDATTLYHAVFTPAAGWSGFSSVGPIEAPPLPVDRGAPNGAGAGDGATLVLALDLGKTPATHTYALGKRVRVSGKLTNAAGLPITGAAVGLAGTRLAAGAAPKPLATATTTAAGTFELTTKAGPGMRIAATYVAFAKDTTAAATASVTARTRAAATLKVSRKRVRRGQRVRFSGRLKGGAVPRGGKLVFLQARERGRWRTFANPRSTRKGAFEARYRFRAAPRRPVRLRFRAIVPTESGYPFLRGRSGTRTIVLRP